MPMTAPVSVFTPDQSGLIYGDLSDAQGEGRPLDLREAVCCIRLDVLEYALVAWMLIRGRDE